MKCAHPVVIDIQEAQIIHLLQDHVARIVEYVRPLMPSHHFKKPVEGCAIVQVLARMQFVANIHARLIKRVENRLPAPTQLLKRLIDQPRRPLRPRIKERPRQRATET